MPPSPLSGEPEVPSVSELTRQIRESLEGRFADVWVEGEISNYRPHSSGHHYFTLKDARAQLSCVMFRGQARALSEPIRDGRQVQARGDLSVYEARGQYQLVVRWMQPRGFGALQAKFEALKRQLEAEGLFDPARKRPLPGFPRTVALVTSPTGAAVRDMLTILSRRAPWLRILVAPVRVQGDGAAAEIAQAIRHLGAVSGTGAAPVIDAMIVGRGGGSLEDLWSFNEEVVARAIFDSAIPVISAVGHEIDFSIADFVADLRAPTPSAAAELLTPDAAELASRLGQLVRRLGLRTSQQVRGLETRLDFHRRSLALREPARRIGDLLQDCDRLRDRLEEAADGGLQDRVGQLNQLRRIMETRHPGAAIADRLRQLGEWRPRFEARLKGAVARREEALRRTRKVLDLLSPETVFQRGYSLTTDRQGRPVTDAATLSPGERLRTRFYRGEVESTVCEGPGTAPA